MSKPLPRVLFAWELGANFGHVSTIAQVAEQLKEAAEIFIALREPVTLRRFAPQLQAHLLPAPVPRTRPLRAGEKPAANIPGMLATEGWDDPVDLAARLEAWHGLFRLVQPDMLVTQAAPTALLAARGQPFRVAQLGRGYDTPPLAEPMPAFDPEAPGAMELAQAQEDATMAVLTTATEMLGVPAPKRFREIFETDETYLITWAATDHFAPRAELQPDHPPYLGPLHTPSSGALRHWAGRPGGRILAYLRPGSPMAAAGFAALDALGPENDIILAAPGISQGDADRLRSRDVQVENGIVQLRNLLADCDIGVSHASSGIGSSFVADVVPQIGLPCHREQVMFSRAVSRAGFGLAIAGRYGGQEVTALIRRALADKAMRARLEAHRRQVGPCDRPVDIVVAESILNLLNCK